MSRKEAISELKASSKRVGRLYPILLDKHGNIIACAGGVEGCVLRMKPPLLIEKE